MKQVISMNSEQQARAVAIIKYIESITIGCTQNITDSITSSFEALIQINPEYVLPLLAQLNEQINEETIRDLVNENDKVVEDFVKDHSSEDDS